MKKEQTSLIQELRELTHKAKASVLAFQNYPLERLNYKPDDTAWSILECIEHLNLYGDFYLPEIEHRITEADASDRQYFKSGLLGGYFVNIIKASSTKKLQATKEMDTTGSDLNASTLDQFLKQLDWLDSLLAQASQVDLRKVKTSISLTSLIKLRLGDTLRFVVYHNERHILQAIEVGKSRQSL